MTFFGPDEPGTRATRTPSAPVGAQLPKGAISQPRCLGLAHLGRLPRPRHSVRSLPEADPGRQPQSGPSILPGRSGGFDPLQTKLRCAGLGRFSVLRWLSKGRDHNFMQQPGDIVAHIFPGRSHAQDNQFERRDDCNRLTIVLGQHERICRDVEAETPTQPYQSPAINRAMASVGYRQRRAHVVDKASRKQLLAVPLAAQP